MPQDLWKDMLTVYSRMICDPTVMDRRWRRLGYHKRVYYRPYRRSTGQRGELKISIDRIRLRLLIWHESGFTSLQLVLLFGRELRSLS